MRSGEVDGNERLTAATGSPVRGRSTRNDLRRLLLASSIVVGAVLAIATVRYAQPWVH